MIAVVDLVAEVAVVMMTMMIAAVALVVEVAVVMMTMIAAVALVVEAAAVMMTMMIAAVVQRHKVVVEIPRNDVMNMGVLPLANHPCFHLKI